MRGNQLYLVIEIFDKKTVPSHNAGTLWKRSHFLWQGVIKFMHSINRCYGTVQNYDHYAGRGTIALEDGREVLVRYSAIRGQGVRSLEPGTPVSFMIEETPRGQYAVCVQLENTAQV